MLTTIYRLNKIIATATIRFIVIVAIVVYKGSIPVAYRMNDIPLAIICGIKDIVICKNWSQLFISR